MKILGTSMLSYQLRLRLISRRARLQIKVAEVIIEGATSQIATYLINLLSTINMRGMRCEELHFRCF